jgi:Zn-dependent M28 family amino/carboxypeptidase
MILRTLLLASALASAAHAQDFTPDRFRSHVEFLASDLMEGRDAGTRGYDLAASYVASQFLGLGLTPGGAEGSWYQPVPFVEALRSSASVSIGGKSFDVEKDVAVGASTAGVSQELTAAAVFAGYGVDAADYRGLDVRGKYVVLLSGFPKGMPSEVGAHLNSMKARLAQEQGALGVITIRTLAEQKRRGFDYSIKGSREPAIAWANAEGQAFANAPGIRVSASFDTAAAEALFAGASRPLAQVLAEADRQGGRPKGFALKPQVSISRASTHRRFTSPNVLGVIPGSDPALKDEYVLLMAHLDHEGTDPKLAGEDKIYNGAMDNATGIATMLEVARAFTQGGAKPKRPILLAAVTAEEDGLLGAEYLAKQRLPAGGKVVGVVNLDMPVLLYDFTDVIAFGANHSSLGPTVRAAAAQAGVALAEDPLPQEGLFTRSDHYKFVREGVPSVFLMTGFGNGGDKQFTGFLSTHYHKVTDDLKLPINWRAGAKFARINYLIAKEIADAPEAPKWNADSFFNPAKSR